MIHEKLARLGSFSLTLEKVPADVVNALEFAGRILVIPGTVVAPDATAVVDLEQMARYAGIVRRRQASGIDSVTVSGAGMAVLAGDEDDKGPVFADAYEVTGQDMATAVAGMVTTMRAAGDLHLTAGTLTDPGGGNITETFQWVSLRTALEYMAGLVDGYWRVNADGTIDVGAQSDLFKTTPEAVIVRRPELVGNDTARTVAAGRLSTELASEDYTTKVVLAAALDGAAVSEGDAEAVTFPFTGVDGLPYRVTRVVRESTTSSSNATARAQLQLNRFNRTRQAVMLDTDTHAIVGRVAVGDQVHVYDPDLGIVGTDEIAHQGTLITPESVQVIGMSWPVHAGHTVVYVHGDGTVTDLTRYVRFETGRTTIEVGEYPRVLGTVGNAAAASIADTEAATPVTPDTTTPDQVVIGTVLTGTYRSAAGDDLAYFLVPWTQPLNTDATAITDGAYYEVQHREQGATEWRSTFIGFDQTNVELAGLTPDVVHDIRIRAVDTGGNRGAWSAITSVASSVDTIAPSTPTSPTVAGNPLAILVTHDLQAAAGGALEADTAVLEVHVGTTSGFSPSDATRVGEIAVAGPLQAGITAVGSFPEYTDATRYVKVIAVDRAGNRSTASASATVTADLLDEQYIGSLTADIITSGSMSADRISGGTITGVDITGVTITGSTLQTATSGRRSVISPSVTTISWLEGSTDVTGLAIYTGDGTETSPAIVGSYVDAVYSGLTTIVRSPKRSGSPGEAYLRMTGSAGTASSAELVANTIGLRATNRVQLYGGLSVFSGGGPQSTFPFSLATERFRVDTSGNVFSGGGRYYFGVGSDDFLDHDDGTGDWEFQDDSTGVFRFARTGTFTSYSGGASRNWSVHLSGNGLAEWWFSDRDNPSDPLMAWVSANGASANTCAILYADGDWLTDTGALGVLSDRRIKDNVVYLEDVLDPSVELRKFRPRQFDRTHTVNEGSRKLIEREEPLVGEWGWIAQEAPKWLRKKRGIYHSIQQMRMLPMLHGGWLDHDNELAAQAGRIEQLEAQVQELLEAAA